MAELNIKLSRENLLFMISRMNLDIPNLGNLQDYQLVHIALNHKDLSTWPMDIIQMIVQLLDDKSFSRLVALFPTLARDVANNKEWYANIFARNNMLFGRYHTTNDTPIIGPTGFSYYYKYGKLHREYGPAVMKHTKHCWMKNGLLCRSNDDYVEISIQDNYLVYGWTTTVAENPTKNVYHRDNDLPAKIVCNIGQSLNLEDYYKIDESSIIAKIYFVHGRHHRENGPMIEFTDKKYVNLWYYNGKRICNPEHPMDNHNSHEERVEHELREILKYATTLDIKFVMKKLKAEYQHYDIVSDKF